MGDSGLFLSSPPSRRRRRDEMLVVDEMRVVDKKLESTRARLARPKQSKR